MTRLCKFVKQTAVTVKNVPIGLAGLCSFIEKGIFNFTVSFCMSFIWNGLSLELTYGTSPYSFRIKMSQPYNAMIIVHVNVN